LTSSQSVSKYFDSANITETDYKENVKRSQFL